MLFTSGVLLFVAGREPSSSFLEALDGFRGLLKRLDVSQVEACPYPLRQQPDVGQLPPCRRSFHVCHLASVSGCTRRLLRSMALGSSRARGSGQARTPSQHWSGAWSQLFPADSSYH